jgi:excisionase family DNA binding protein
MQAVTITQISTTELETLIEGSLRKILLSQQVVESTPTDELLTVQDTAKFLHLSVPTIYGLIHKGELPVMKRSKRCYFSRHELLEYMKQGRKKTIVELGAEIKNERDTYLLTKKKKG